MSVRVRMRGVLAVVAVVVGVLVGVVGAQVAQASFGHEFIKSFNGSDNPSFPEGFATPMGVAVDRVSGGVYVSDNNKGVVDVFSGEGVWQSQLTGPPGAPFQEPRGVAFDQANEDVYVMDRPRGAGAVDVFSTALDGYLSPITYAGFEGPKGVAVDEATGDVLVTDGRLGVVDVFGVHGEFLSQWGGAGTPSGSFGGAYSYVAVAVDNSKSVSDPAAGDVYVTDEIHRVVDVLRPGPSGEEVYLGRELSGPPGGFSGSGPVGVAVDPGTGEVYVTDNGADAVDQFNATGGYMGAITGPPGGSFGRLSPEGAGGVAVAANGDVYVIDNGDRVVDVFGRDAQLPSAMTGGVSGVGVSGATLEGVVNPESGTLDAHYYFQYGTSTAYGSTSPALPGTDAGTGTSGVPASTTLSGLAPATAYHYRLVAVNSEGRAYGQDATFQTLGPPIVGSECSEGVGNRGVTLCAQVNPDGFDTTYHFEYGTTAGYGSSVPVPDGDLGAGTSEAPASAVVTGLAASTEYHYRIVATNSQGTVDGPDQSFVTLPAALVEGESVSNVESTAADVQASVNPLGTDTSFRVEYGTSVSYGSSTSVRDVGFASEALGESVVLLGLQPGTTYHFRFVASNSLGTVDGVDQMFTTFPSSSAGAGGSCSNEELRLENGSGGLPDCRAYELVSPVDKSGGMGGVLEPLISEYELQQGSLLEGASVGGAVTYLGEDFYQPRAGGVNERYVSVRGSSGWLTQNVSPLLSSDQEAEDRASETQRSRFVAGFSPDLSKSVVSSSGQTVPLAAGGPAGYGNLWLRDGVDGAYRPLITTIPPDRLPSEFGYWSLSLRGMFNQTEAPLFAGASADFSRIFLEANAALTPDAPAVAKDENNLYEWSENSLRLVNVLPEGASAPGAYFGYEAGAEYTASEPNLSHVISANGSRVFWTDTQNGDLYVREGGTKTVQVDAAVGGGGQFWTASVDGSKVLFTKGGALYEFDVDTGAMIDLAPSGVKGVVGVSEDGSYVYFVSGFTLSLWHEGATIAVTTLSPEDNNYFMPNLESNSPLGDWVATFAGRTAEVSSDGRYLAFMKGGEVFLYDAASGRLDCASCSPSGGGSGLPLAPENGVYQPRYVNDKGEVFFQTESALVAQDVNGQMDVYEYEQQSGVHLISSGTGSASEFADASANGEDVFFVTNSQLVPKDQDRNYDLYDARVGGGFPAPVSVSCSDASGCRGEQGAQPVFGAPSSAVFSGAGNLTATQSTTVSSVHRAVKKALKKKRAKKKRKARARKRAARAGRGKSGRLGKSTRAGGR